MKRHIEDATTSKIAHFIICDKYGKQENTMKWINAFSFSGIVVSWFISTQVFTLLENGGFNISVVWSTVTQSVIPILFVIASIISTTVLFLNRYGEKSRSHREAAQRYQRLWRKALNNKTEYPTIIHAKELAKRAVIYRDELNEINNSSPDIEEWAWVKVSLERKKGGTEYDVDNS